MHSFYHVTEMIKDDKETFLTLIQDVMKKKNDFLAFSRLFDDSYSGVEVELYELDGDTYNYDVVKWGIDYQASQQNKLIIKGYALENFYKLIAKDSRIEVFYGDDESFDNYINVGDLESLTRSQFDEKFEIEIDRVDKYRHWLKGFEDVEIEFFPVD